MERKGIDVYREEKDREMENEGNQENGRRMSVRKGRRIREGRSA